MSGKIRVKVCVGTTCYVMGGGDLLIIKDLLPPHMHNKVTVDFIPCLGHCKKHGASKAPFVEVNGSVLTSCSTLSILNYLEERIQRGPI